jgi:hypothetical protein
MNRHGFVAEAPPTRADFAATMVVMKWLGLIVVLLKLAEGEEDFFISGPRVPSSEFADPAHRPALEVTYLPP